LKPYSVMVTCGGLKHAASVAPKPQDAAKAAAAQAAAEVNRLLLKWKWKEILTGWQGNRMTGEQDNRGNQVKKIR
jgi:hypothetical protein